MKPKFRFQLLYAALTLVAAACSMESQSEDSKRPLPNPVSPLSAVITPAHGAQNVSLAPALEIQFNREVSDASIRAATLTLKDSAGLHLTLGLNGSDESGRVVLTLSQPLSPAMKYTLTVHGGPDGVLDLDGTSLIQPLSSTFTTRKATLANGLKLITWEDIAAKFTGTFAVPSGDNGSGTSFIFSSGSHAQLANGNLLMRGQSTRQSRLQLPSVLNGESATWIGPWSDLSEGLQPKGFSSSEPYEVGGMLEVGQRVFFTKHQWYNGSGTDWPSLGYQEDGKAKGMWQVTGKLAHNQRVGGYMTYAPSSLEELGYAFLVGQQGQSGAANGRWGPNLFAIPAGFPAATTAPVEARPLVVHQDETHGLKGWWIGDMATSAAWIQTKTHQGLVFFVSQQLGGVTWYGEPGAGPGGAKSPYGGNKGFHASGYVLRALIYNPDDLWEVFEGKRNPWSVTPVQTADLISRPPGSAKETYHGFLTGPANQGLESSYRNGRLILMQTNGTRLTEYDATPKGYVLQLE